MGKPYRPKKKVLGQVAAGIVSSHPPSVKSVLWIKPVEVPGGTAFLFHRWDGTQWVDIAVGNGGSVDWNTLLSGDQTLIDVQYNSSSGELSFKVEDDLSQYDNSVSAFLTSESDPVFSASAAAGISIGDISNWNQAFGWGDHAQAGYLQSESDPVFTASPASGISNSDINNWNEAHGWGDHAQAGYLQSESDPVFTGSPAAGISAQNIIDWTEAHNWGDHAQAGYLQSESDPVFTSSPAAGISNQNISNWNEAHGWGDHANQGYITEQDNIDTARTYTKGQGLAMVTLSIVSGQADIDTKAGNMHKLDMTEDIELIISGEKVKGSYYVRVFNNGGNTLSFGSVFDEIHGSPDTTDQKFIHVHYQITENDYIVATVINQVDADTGA